MSPERIGWRAHARCANHGNLWEADKTAASIAWAKDQCAGCPVLEQCRAWVLKQADDPCPWHIVAGMTPRERVHAPRRHLAVVSG